MESLRPWPPEPEDDPATLAGWIAAGRRNQFAWDIYFHARTVFHAGGSRRDCPFGAAFPVARERWLWMFGVAAKAEIERTVKARAQGLLFPCPRANPRGRQKTRPRQSAPISA